MSQFTQKNLRFHPVSGKTVRADFQGGERSSDFGAILLREVIQKSGLTTAFSAAIDDHRDQRYIDHPMIDLINQRVLQMACGYEDANDSNTLRKDPMFKYVQTCCWQRTSERRQPLGFWLNIHPTWTVDKPERYLSNRSCVC